MKHSKRTILSLLLVVVVFIQACKKDNPETSNTIVNTVTHSANDSIGTLKGTVLAANHTSVIPNARVYAEVAGTIYSTQTTVDGQFNLGLPEGSHTVHIITGKGKLFHTEISVSITAGETKTLSTDEAILNQRGQLAHVEGDFDMIENIISSLGYSSTAIGTSAFNFADSLSQYDGIFVNCGAPDLSDMTQYNNLGEFVTNGGSLYVSDFGIFYVMGTGSCPRDMGFVNDDYLCTSGTGAAQTVSGASVLSSDLQAFMGLESIDVNYDLGWWEEVISYDENFWEVLISHPSVGPMLLRTNQFSMNTQGNQGNIYFTTFHNEAATLNTPDVALVLQFMILNL